MEFINVANDGNRYFQVHEADEMREFLAVILLPHTSLTVTSMITTQLASHSPRRDIYISAALFACCSAA